MFSILVEVSCSHFPCGNSMWEFLLSPDVVVISVGSKNKYGHPTPFILELLKSKNTKLLRTDQNGEVEIVSDGSNFKILKNH